MKAIECNSGQYALDKSKYQWTESAIVHGTIPWLTGYDIQWRERTTISSNHVEVLPGISQSKI